MGRPTSRKVKPGEAQQMSISLDGGIIKAIDDQVGNENAKQRGPKWTRSDVVRDAVLQWLGSRGVHVPPPPLKLKALGNGKFGVKLPPARRR